MISIPTLDRQEAPIQLVGPAKLVQRESFSQQAKSLHQKCATIIISIEVQRELLGDAISEDCEWKIKHHEQKLEALYAEYRDTFFQLLQPIIDKVEE